MDFQKSVIEHLSSAGLSRDALSDLAKSAAEINNAGLKNARILTKGTPHPEWVRISGIADSNSIGELLGKVATKTKGLGGIRVFPYGIPRPDLFQVDIDMGPGAPRGM